MNVAAARNLIVVGGLLLAAAPVQAIDLVEATSLFQAGQYAECAAHCATAIAENQYSETWRTLKIESELALGEYPAALDSLREALDRHSASVRLRWLGHRVLLLNQLPEEAAQRLDEIDTLVDNASWRYSDPASRVALGEYYLFRGADPKSVLDNVFRPLKKRSPSYAETFTACGELALAKHDYALAAEEFQEALKLDGTSARIHLGLARAYAPSDGEKAQQHLEQALARNPRHADSWLYLAEEAIDGERYADAAAALDHVAEINPVEPRLWGFRALLRHLEGDLTSEVACRAAALAWHPLDTTFDLLTGAKLAQKYRFAEAAAALRRGLQLQPDSLPLKLELSQTLLRLGDEAEGWRLAEEVFQRDGYQVVAHNLTLLREHLDRFQTLEADGLLVRMDAREASIYGDRVLQLLTRARQTLCEKYRVTLAEPIVVEIFPNQADFAARTFGLPGGAGFLGVCFGRVVTANSPAALSTPTNWEATLWHEFCHAVTLHKTANKMPRWLSEGISVYEERQANPAWGQAMTPVYRQMILGDDLTPLSQLSSAFLQPKSPLHLNFAYFEASLVVEYLIDRFGREVLLRLLDDLAIGLPIQEALQRYTGAVEAIDQDFAQFARDKAEQLAPGLDFAAPEPPLPAGIEGWRAWLAERPNNYHGLKHLAAALVANEQFADALTPLNQLIELFPGDSSADSALILAADVQRRLGNAAEERKLLEQAALLIDDASPVYQRLLELAVAAEDWEGARLNAERLIAVNPLQRESQRRLAAAAERLGHADLFITALRAWSALDPIDRADVHYRLAVALRQRGELAEARRHVLLALEEAPRFQAALQELLTIHKLHAPPAASDQQK